MMRNEDYRFEKYSSIRVEEELRGSYSRRRSDFYCKDFSCSLWASSFYLFKMEEVESFVLNRLSDYLRKDGTRIRTKKYEKDGHIYTRYFINIDVLEKHCRGDAAIKLWKFKEEVCSQVKKHKECLEDPWLNDIPHNEDNNQQVAEEYPYYSDFTEADEEMEDGSRLGDISDTDAFEQIEIVILSDEYAAIVSTWNFITLDSRDPICDDLPEMRDKQTARREICQAYRLNKLMHEKPYIEVNPRIKPEMENEAKTVYEDDYSHGESYFVLKYAHVKEFRKYFDYTENKYSNSISMLLDVIINKSLDSRFNEITFVYPQNDILKQKKYDSQNGWNVYEDFCDSKTAPCFRFVLLDSNSIPRMKVRKGLRKYIESYISSGHDALLTAEACYILDDRCCTCSLPDGQAVIFFNVGADNESNKLYANYLDYRFSFLDALFRRSECAILGEEYVRCLKSMKYGNLPSENSTEVFLGKLKLLKNDVSHNVSQITEDSIATLWLQKTKTLEMADSLEMICNYLVDNARDKRSQKQQNILGVISIAGIIALISVVGDCWTLITEKQPAGKSVVLAAVLGCAFFIVILVKSFFNTRNWPRCIKRLNTKRKMKGRGVDMQ